MTWWWSEQNYRNRKFWDPRFQSKEHQANRYSRRFRDFEWRHLHFWKSDEWKEIREFINLRKKQGIQIYPSYNIDVILKSLDLVSFKDTKILLLGNCPYVNKTIDYEKTKGADHGIPFSCPPRQAKIPKYLHQIFRSYRKELGYPYPRSGYLWTWCNNGILLGQSVWTVEKGSQSNLHYKINGKKLWQKLTEEIITVLRDRKKKFVFIYLGRVAQEFATLTRKSKNHLTIEAPHPSPFSRMGDAGQFKDAKIFKKSSDFLGDKRIWRLQ